MKIIRRFSRIIDSQMIIVSILSVMSTYVCLRFKLAADLPSGLIGIAVVFPVVFSINAAYRRREEALGYFADLKAHCMALYYANRDWVPKENRSLLFEKEFRDLLLRTFGKIHQYLRISEEDKSEEDKSEGLYSVYCQFSDISKYHEKLRSAGVPANEISRANQYLKGIMVDFEKLRNIRLYRTPVSLRAYSHIFLNTFPIIFGPFFANISMKYYVSAGYFLAFLYSVILVSLDNIQEELENPFDEKGEDDLRLDVRDECSTLMNEK